MVKSHFQQEWQSMWKIQPEPESYLQNETNSSIWTLLNCEAIFLFRHEKLLYDSMLVRKNLEWDSQHSHNLAPDQRTPLKMTVPLCSPGNLDMFSFFSAMLNHLSYWNKTTKCPPTYLSICNANKSFIHQLVCFRVSGLSLHYITLSSLVCQRNSRGLENKTKWLAAISCRDKMPNVKVWTRK